MVLVQQACDPDAGTKRVLRSLAEALWPRNSEEAAAAAKRGSSAEVKFWQSSGSDFDVSEEVLTTIKQAVHGINLMAILLSLRLLQWRVGTLLFAGRHCFSSSWPYVQTCEEMTVADRQKMIISWRDSSLQPLQAIFKALKSIILSALVSAVDDKGNNPFWAAMRYTPGRDVPLIAEPLASACEAEEVLASGVLHLPDLLAIPGLSVQAYLTKHGFSPTTDTDGFATDAKPVPTSTAAGLQAVPVAEIGVDAVVLGSGAGGSTAAAVLAAAGMRVLVVEKSTWRRMSDLTWMEAESTMAMYEGAGFVPTECGGVGIVAGSTLGGGTKINWTVCFRTPDHVRQEWATQHGLPNFAPGPGPFSDSLDAVCKRLVVNYNNRHNAANRKLWEGLEEVGAKPETMPRNCLAEECSAYCNFGCKMGAKQSADVTYLADAVKRGARVLTGCFAERVLVEKQQGEAGGADGVKRTKRVTGVVLAATGSSSGQEQRCRIIVHAPMVVASCGSIHTPALLLRSGVSCHGNVGRHLHIHPASGLVLKFPMTEAQRAGHEKGPIDGYQGAAMSVCSKAVADWEGSGYGAIVSVPNAHPGMLGALAPWTPNVRKVFVPLTDGSLNVVYTRDRTEGQVKIDGSGWPRLHYFPNEEDGRNILKGLELAVRAAIAAGATSVSVPFLHEMAYHVDANHSEAALQAYIDKIRATKLRHTEAMLFSAHQMGTARMGASPRTSVCDGNGECWEVAGLHIADASAFPTASGVNPMITALAIAYMNAGAIVQKHRAMCTQ